MRIKKARKPLDPDIKTINTQLPSSLIEAMREIQQARRRLEGSTPRLCLLYKEAVEMYVGSKANQQLLNGSKPLRKTA